MTVRYGERLAQVRVALAASALDGLLVTHPPNLRYLVGFDGSVGACLLGRSTCTLFVDGRYITAAHASLKRTPSLAEVEVTLVDRSHDESIVQAVLADAGLRRLGIEGAVLPVSRYERLLAALNPDGDRAVQIVATERIVERVRMVKDAAEVATLREAARRLSRVARDVLPAVAAGRTERQIAAEVDAGLRAAGFERPAFDTIVASGPNGALPHARAGDRRLHAGDGVLLDFGGVYDGYCVDLTRTVQLDPPSDSFQRLFAAVRRAHAAALAAVAPGVLASAVDRAARDVLADEGLSAAFPHGTGHGLGLEVHEEPRISRVGAHDEPLLAGMVFTIEPGAYVPGLGGVRIEDDVVVVEGGCEVLTDVPIERTVGDRRPGPDHTDGAAHRPTSPQAGE